MDGGDLVPAYWFKDAPYCGVNDKLPIPGEDGVVSRDGTVSVENAVMTPGPNQNLDNVTKLEGKANDLSPVNVPQYLDAQIEGTGLATSKEEGHKGTNDMERHKVQSSFIKSKKEKLSTSRNVSASKVKKSKDEKDVDVTSAISSSALSLNLQSKQPLKSKSFNDRQVQISKQFGKSNVPSALVEKTKPRPLQNVILSKAEGESPPSLSPKSGDPNPQMARKLPNYGFSFKCDERAEKRKEFYSQIEEKIHAKEVEKNNLQAKSEENQEAEIRMLRKSLRFKATPMPSFYQEQPSPKTELKKIPPTRAKSPKLGRRKSSSTMESEGNSHSSQPGLSLDEKVNRNSPEKDISSLHTKKPERKSLPSKLSSEKVRLTISRNREKNKQVRAREKKNSSTANSADGEKAPLPSAATETTSLVKNQLVASSAETSELDLHTDNWPLVEGQVEPVAALERVLRGALKTVSVGQDPNV